MSPDILPPPLNPQDDPGVDSIETDEHPPAPSSVLKELHADPLREGTASAFLYSTIASFFLNLDVGSYKAFRDRLIADCGSPDDPIEIILIEQLMLAHFNTGRLHYRSATATNLDEARVYASAAVNLAGEVRRSALGLKAYREPSRSTEQQGLPRVVTDDETGFVGNKAARRRTGS